MIPILVGIAGLTITVILHSVATTIVIHLLTQYAPAFLERKGKNARPFILAASAAFLSVKHYLDIILWAIAFRYLVGSEDFQDFETAVYFSSVTYTALGYGDIVASGSYRLLCGIEAMNGILLFGWSTALLFVLVQRMWIAEQAEAVQSRKNSS